MLAIQNGVEPKRMSKNLERLNNAILNRTLPDQQNRKDILERKELDINHQFKVSISKDYIGKNRRSLKSNRPSNPYHQKPKPVQTLGEDLLSEIMKSSRHLDSGRNFRHRIGSASTTHRSRAKGYELKNSFIAMQLIKSAETGLDGL